MMVPETQDNTYTTSFTIPETQKSPEPTPAIFQDSQKTPDMTWEYQILLKDPFSLLKRILHIVSLLSRILS